MKMQQLVQTFTILKLPARAKIPDWALTSRVFSITKTDDELSLVCESRLVPPTVENRSDGWTCLKVEGLLDFAQTGILSSIAGPLAKAKISIFAISTYNTDYVLIKSDQLVKAKEALHKSGFLVPPPPELSDTP